MRILLIGLAALAGCATKHELSTVIPADDGFQLHIKTAHPDLETENGKEQLRWIAETNAENNFCPNGYEITERRVIRNGSALGQDLHSVTYKAICL